MENGKRKTRAEVKRRERGCMRDYRKEGGWGLGGREREREREGEERERGRRRKKSADKKSAPFSFLSTLREEHSS
jgi:hypothetical protein